MLLPSHSWKEDISFKHGTTLLPRQHRQTRYLHFVSRGLFSVAITFFLSVSIFVVFRRKGGSLIMFVKERTTFKTPFLGGCLSQFSLALIFNIALSVICVAIHREEWDLIKGSKTRPRLRSKDLRLYRIHVHKTKFPPLIENPPQFSISAASHVHLSRASLSDCHIQYSWTKLVGDCIQRETLCMGPRGGHRH